MKLFILTEILDFGTMNIGVFSSYSKAVDALVQIKVEEERNNNNDENYISQLKMDIYSTAKETGEDDFWIGLEEEVYQIETYNLDEFDT